MRAKTPEVVCIELMNKYQTEKAGLLKGLEHQLEESQAAQSDAQEWVGLIRQYRSLEALDREILLKGTGNSVHY